VLYLSGKVLPDVPAMLTPRMRRRPLPGQVWAADNGRYAAPQDYSDEAYLAWLALRSEERGACLFATAPDTFGDAVATLRDSRPLLPRIRALGYPAALVAQPDMTVEMTPWDEFDVLFVGGPNTWQHSEPLIALVHEAKRRGKWVHMGRVNTRRRIHYAESLGVDSVDGTILRFDPTRPIVRWTADAPPSLWRPT
jgi:hypothetical protein